MRNLLKTYKASLFLILFVCSASVVLAQADLRTYRLQPEDIIAIRVYNEQDLSLDAQVGMDGTISYPFLGFIKVAGKTVSEVQSYIRNELIAQGYYKDPKVSVNIIRFRVLRASVVGIAQKPGQYEFKPGDRLLSLLAQAGGVVPGRSHLKRATLIRRGSVEQVPIDLRAMLERGDLSQNYELQDGDVLNIPEDTMNKVNVIGAVATPRTIEWRENMTLADAISSAGGEIPYKTKFSAVQIQRIDPSQPGGYYSFKVNFIKFLKDNDFSQNPFLEPGDIVFVPSTSTPDFNRLSQVANIVFVIQSITQRNFFFKPF